MEYKSAELELNVIDVPFPLSQYASNVEFSVVRPRRMYGDRKVSTVAKVAVLLSGQWLPSRPFLRLSLGELCKKPVGDLGGPVAEVD